MSKLQPNSNTLYSGKLKNRSNGVGTEKLHGAFEAWLEDLKRVFISKYDYTDANAKRYVDENKTEWREFFDMEYDAESAAYEDTLAGVQ